MKTIRLLVEFTLDDLNRDDEDWMFDLLFDRVDFDDVDGWQLYSNYMELNMGDVKVIAYDSPEEGFCLFTPIQSAK